jgi:hypothetical protein
MEPSRIVVEDRTVSRAQAELMLVPENAVDMHAAVGALPEIDGGAGGSVLDATLARAVALDRGYVDQKDAIVERFTRAYLRAVMRAAGDNQAAAARMAQIDRSYRVRLLAKHGRRP